MAVSFLHEALVDLFRERPELAPELLRDALHVELPPYAEARIESADLSQLEPAELRADLVVLLRDGQPVLAIVVEVQLAPSPRKRYTWPAYLVGIRARFECDACVLVVAPTASVARWAREPIELGPGGRIAPLVLGPDTVPIIEDGEQARSHPDLAILSAIAHGTDARRGPSVALAALGALSDLEDDRARLYWDLIYSSLSGAARTALEELMSLGHYEYQSDFAKKYVAQGRAEGEAEGEARGKAEGEARGKAEGEARGKAEGKAEGKADALLHVLAARALSVSAEQRERILSTTDLAMLDRWIGRAVTVGSADALFLE